MTNIEIIKKYFLKKINEIKNYGNADIIYENIDFKTFEMLLEKGFGAELHKYQLVITDNEYEVIKGGAQFFDIMPKLERCVPKCIVSFNILLNRVVGQIYIKNKSNDNLDFWEEFFNHAETNKRMLSIAGEYFNKHEIINIFKQYALRLSLSNDGKKNIELDSEKPEISNMYKLMNK